MSNYKYAHSIYVIRCATSGIIIKFGSKAACPSKGAAKNAFNLHMTSYFGKSWSEGAGLYDNQTEFKICEVV